MAEVIEISDDSTDDEADHKIKSRPAIAACPILRRSIYGSNDNTKDDSDIELLEVRPPTVQNSSFKPLVSRSSLLYSDDDDDDDDFFFSKSASRGLTSKSPSSAPQGETLIESWRKQCQTDTDRKETKGTAPKATKYVTEITPSDSQNGKISWNSTPGENVIFNSQAETKTPLSSSIVVKKKIFNPYAKTKTPPTNTKSVTIRTNPYSNKSGKNRSQSISKDPLTCDLRPPKLRADTKKYRDIRPNITLALWKYARKQLVSKSREAKCLDQFVGRIVDLVVAAPDFPIRSLGEYAVRKRGDLSKWGCGAVRDIGGFDAKLKSTTMMKCTFEHIEGKYFSISEACLVAMMEMIAIRHSRSKQDVLPTDEASQDSLFSQRGYYISLADLIPQIDRRLHPSCPSKLKREDNDDMGVSYYLKKSTRSVEFKQIEKLLAPVEVPKSDGSIEKTSYIKKRMVNKIVHYQLLPLGYQKAVMISRRRFPKPPGPYRFCNLNSVPSEYAGICLAVDLREGGSENEYREVLHKMCNKLDLQKIPYCVNSLKIGDYCFFSGDKLCPIFVERKSIEDVVESIHDGRWEKQKDKMYKGQYVFGCECRIVYIIEGNVKKHLVSNDNVADEGYKISVERFKEEVNNLRNEGFEVLETCSVDNSMFELSRWAESIARDVRSGKLKLEYTYDQFVEKLKNIPKSVDFSHNAKYYAKKRLDSVFDQIGDEKRGNISPIDLDDLLRKVEKRKMLDTSSEAQSKAGASKRLKFEECKKIKTRGIVDNGSPPGERKKMYENWTVKALRQECVDLGMKKSGSRAELLAQLADPSNIRPPVYRLRKKKKLYVPKRADTAATAMLVAIQIAQDDADVGPEKYRGSTKDEIIEMCKRIDISKDPFCGGATQTGTYDYSGWSSMKFLKQSGDPPLVVEKNRRFRLSMTGDVCGIKLAREMHVWCHIKGICKCSEVGYNFDPETWK